MKSVLSAVLLAAALAAPSAAQAQGSLLRVTCEGNAVGAEVSVNGKFKGECPLDIPVAAGPVKLRAVKKGDGAGEKMFEWEARMGDGAIKRIEVLFSPPPLSASAKLAEDARMGQTRAAVAKAAQVRQTPPDPLSQLQGTWCWESGGVSGQNIFAGNTVQVRAGTGIFSGSNSGTVAVLNDHQIRISLTNREQVVTLVDNDSIRWDADGTIGRRCAN